MTNTPLRILNLQEAAALLCVHKTTLSERAKAGLVPAAKVGRAWTFIEQDLVTFLREQYSCHSTKTPAAKSGGSASRSPATNGYENQLVKLLVQRRKESTTNAKQRSGKSHQP